MRNGTSIFLQSLTFVLYFEIMRAKPAFEITIAPI